MQKRIIMCVLVYPKDETQKALLTSFLEEKNMDFDYNISDSETSNEYLQVLLKRADEITEILNKQEELLMNLIKKNESNILVYFGIYFLIVEELSKIWIIGAINAKEDPNKLLRRLTIVNIPKND